MANFQLPNDWVLTVPVVTQNAAGAIVPPPPSDTFTVVSNNPASLQAVMDSTGKSVVLNALVQVSPGVSFTVSDAAGLQHPPVLMDIVADAVPAMTGVDFTGASHTTQAVPTAPGP